jgi:hypothetical protein
LDSTYAFPTSVNCTVAAASSGRGVLPVAPGHGIAALAPGGRVLPFTVAFPIALASASASAFPLALTTSLALAFACRIALSRIEAGGVEAVEHALVRGIVAGPAAGIVGRQGVLGEPGGGQEQGRDRGRQCRQSKARTSHGGCSSRKANESKTDPLFARREDCAQRCAIRDGKPSEMPENIAQLESEKLRAMLRAGQQ